MMKSSDDNLPKLTVDNPVIVYATFIGEGRSHDNPYASVIERGQKCRLLMERERFPSFNFLITPIAILERAKERMLSPRRISHPYNGVAEYWEEWENEQGQSIPDNWYSY